MSSKVPYKHPPNRTHQQGRQTKRPKTDDWVTPAMIPSIVNQDYNHSSSESDDSDEETEPKLKTKSPPPLEKSSLLLPIAKSSSPLPMEKPSSPVPPCSENKADNSKSWRHLGEQNKLGRLRRNFRPSNI